MRRQQSIFACGLFAICVAILITHGSAQQRNSADRHPIASPDPSPPRILRQVSNERLIDEVSTISQMHAKLDSSRKVLSGLVTEDFDVIEQAADALLKTAAAAEEMRNGGDMEDKVYGHFRNEFGRLAGDLKEMAQRRNLEGAAYIHSNLTANCIACHQHLRDTKSGIELLGGQEAK